MAQSFKIIVFDDDPTGSQTVHDCPLLLRFSEADLAAGLADPSPLLFLITNSRGLEPAQVRQLLLPLCQKLKPLLARLDRPWLLVSRGDSTLRGHFPLEHDLIAEQLGPFAGTLLVPAFPQGGRSTVDGLQLLHGEPVHRSVFAQDRRFGYSSSDLAVWAEQKSGGRWPAQASLRLAVGSNLTQRLAQLPPGGLAIADAQTPADLEQVAAAVLARAAAGQRLLLQSAASVLNGLAAVPSQLLPPGPGIGPGLVLVGSHLPLADQQLQLLLEEPSCQGVEAPLQGPLQHCLSELEAIRARGYTPVLFSQRGEAQIGAEQQRQLAQRLAELVAALQPPLGYVIAKGGTTSFSLLQHGLGLGTVQLLGQPLLGVNLVRPRDAHQRFGLIHVLTFPGNVGHANGLLQAWRWLEGFDQPGLTP